MNTSSLSVPKPVVASTGSTGAFLVELLIWNGFPFKNHWAYFVRSHTDPDIGVKIHATGDVSNGFVFEIKRSENLQTTDDAPSARVPLQWVDAQYFEEKAMLNHGEYKIDHSPVCGFEECVQKIRPPGKSLNTVGEGVSLTHGVLPIPAHIVRASVYFGSRISAN
jgi:hypothetical protein